MNDMLRLAMVQCPCGDDAGGNPERVAAAIHGAAARGADLVLLPELHNGPYFCQTADTEQFALAEPVPGPTTERLGRLAASTSMVIIGSVFERRMAGIYHNTAVVLERSGNLAGCYRKMHIPDDPGYHEKFYFTPGDQGFRPIDTSVGRLGVMVCWDQWFPEAARIMSLAGAELLLYPTAIGYAPEDDEAEQGRQLNSWVTIQRAHAIANGLPVAACNRVGHEAHPGGHTRIEFWGNSFVCGPQGDMLWRADGSNAVTEVVEVDRCRSERVRSLWPFLRDRRVDAYAEVLQRVVDEHDY